MIEKRTCVKQGVERSVFLLSLFNKKFCRKDSWLTTSNCPMISECVKSRLCFSSVQSLSHVRLFVTPCIAAHQASLSITSSRSSLKFTSIESVIPSSHLILCRPFSSCPQSLPASESFPLSPWCHPTISSSVISMSSHLQSLPSSESLPMSQIFELGDQRIRVSFSASVLPMHIQD